MSWAFCLSDTYTLAVVQGYSTFWFGKGHTGYKSFYHLPLQLGFDRFAGFLGGGERTALRLQAPLTPGRVAHPEAPLYAAAQSHFATKRWEGNCPLTPANDTYSAELYGELAHAALMEYDETAQDAPPLFCARRRPSLLRCWFGGRRLCPTRWLSWCRLG